MARPEPPQTAPVSTGLAEEDPRAAEELAQGEGLTIAEGPAAAGLAFEGSAVEDGLAAADAAMAGLPTAAPDEAEPAAVDDLVLDADEERYLRGHEPTRALPAEEMDGVDDWDDQTAAEQENMPEYEQQG